MSTANSTSWARRIEPQPTGDVTLPSRILGSLWGMLAVSACFLALRLYCRAFRVRHLWWDDYLLIVGWTLLLCSTALQTSNFNHGYLVTVLSDPAMSPVNLASESTLKLALAFCKTSIAFTLYRFTSRWLRWIVVTCAVVVNLFCLVQATAIWGTLCGVHRFHHVYPCGVLTEGIWMWRIGCLVSAVTDLTLCLVPIIIIWKLKMPRREKIGVGVASSLGLFAGVVAVITAGRTDGVRYTHGRTFSYDLARICIWVAAETHAAIVASSIPVLRVLLRDFGQRYSSPASSEPSDYPKLNAECGASGAFSGPVTRTSVHAGGNNDSGTSITTAGRRNSEIKPPQQIVVEREWNRVSSDVEKGDTVEMTTRSVKAG
ncbi:hypothetical protein C8034_v008183 [Colletotrichum sidae]|uniref:Rhodopsin domain-containing protein n=1 Tax=Colletotrichum sidae TaxID=1347389 RepID=A0A4R8TQY2_9PEZI|nr:hypothetical protein C8034_v008183 [Colletotrichum sidae]